MARPGNPSADEAVVEAPQPATRDEPALDSGAKRASVSPTAVVLGRDGTNRSLLGLYTSFDNSLANSATDISFEERRLILLDPQVSSQLVIRRNAVLIDGIQILPSAEEDDESAYKIAKENADFCRWLFEELPGGLYQRLLELEQRDILCNTAGDVRWVEKDWGQKYRGKLVIKSMPVFSPRDYTVWQSGGEVIGLQPKSMGISNPNPPVYGMDKFAWLPFRPEPGNPYGTDLIPAIYMPWKKKVEGHPLEMMYMDLFSNPSIVGTAPEDAIEPVKLPTGRKMPDGSPEYLLGPDNQPLTVSPAEAMALGIAGFTGSGGQLTIPAKAHVDLLQAAGDGRIFSTFFDKENWEIMVAINGTGNMTGRAKYGSNATAQTGEEAVYLTGWGERYQVAAMIRGICERAIKWNFPERNRDFIPTVTCGDVNADQLWVLLRSIVANMAGAELLVPEICRRLGVKAPDIGALKEAQQAQLPGTVKGSTPVSGAGTPRGDNNATGNN